MLTVTSVTIACSATAPARREAELPRDHLVTPSPAVTLNLNSELLWHRDNGRIVLLVHSAPNVELARTAVQRLSELAGELGGMPIDLIDQADAGFPEFSCSLDDHCNCPTQPISPTYSYIDVLPVRSEEHFFGWSRTVQLDQGCSVHHVYRIVINLRAINANAVLGLTSARLETRDVVHEYGHLLGLCSGSDHCYLTANGHSRHCRSADCAMSGPTTEAKMYAFFHTALLGKNVDDYCELCRRDIAEAKAVWERESKAESH